MLENGFVGVLLQLLIVGLVLYGIRYVIRLFTDDGRIHQAADIVVGIIGLIVLIQALLSIV